MFFLKRIFSDFRYIVKEEGFASACFKSFKVVFGIIGHKLSSLTNFKSEVDNTCYDVVFINGCWAGLPHPIRYRVDHQMEQAMAAGYSVKRVEADDFCKETLRHGRTFIIFRCCITDQIRETIEFAKKINKRIIFDIDDLVIDTKYTDPIPYLDTMSENERYDYDNGVNLMKETLILCDAAITTTEVLANELRNYVERVYVNRNVASEEMLSRSEVENFKRDKLPYLPDNEVKFLQKKCKKIYEKRLEERKTKNFVRIGYFSGSITHNDDFELVKPALINVMRKRENVRLLLMGEIDVPKDLNEFRDRIEFMPFCDWKRLPHAIASCDINIAPLVDSLFNRAKSENKWVEASLIKVPTIASNVGAFADMIKNGETGILCSNRDDWEESLIELIDNRETRDVIAVNAYNFCKEFCTTINTCTNFDSIIKQERIKNYVFVLPVFEQAGGTLVVYRHASYLQKKGYDVLMLGSSDDTKWVKINNIELPCLNRNVYPGHIENTKIECDIDVGVATFWDTLDYLRRYDKVNCIKYLVQGYEVDFNEIGDFTRLASSQTYLNHFDNIEYLTISKWCQDWLNNKYGRQVKYVPNGIDTSEFYPVKRDFNVGKFKVLIEGDCASDQKNVDEAFRIASHLDPDKFEILYMTNTGKTKPFYRIDRMLGIVSHDKVADVMRECHILIKTSKNESFSYPPLEMMATGGLVLVLKIPGNAEYVKDGENCLTYELGDDIGAARKIENILKDSDLREKIIVGGIKTANRYDWNYIKDDILNLYI